MATIDVVIPTYQNLGELRVCLASLAAQDRQDFRVLVCVDGSTDGTTEYLSGTTFPFRLQVLTHADGANHRAAAARNLALPYLDAEFLLFLDSDMQLAPDGLSRHLDVLGAPDIVSIGGVVYLNARANLWGRYLMTRGKHKRGPGELVRAIDFTTQNSALRTEAFRAVGGFDASFVEYGGEDTELALRLRRDRGVRFLYNAAARADTLEKKSVEQRLVDLRRYGGTNLRKLRKLYPDEPGPFWIDRLDSTRLRDRLLRWCMNPLSDRLARALLPIAPFKIQKQALNYLTLRAIWRGFIES
jgi:glycosyltransferase involved in cell wall biosynthesis